MVTKTKKPPERLLYDAFAVVSWAGDWTIDGIFFRRDEADNRAAEHEQLGDVAVVIPVEITGKRPKTPRSVLR